MTFIKRILHLNLPLINQAKSSHIFYKNSFALTILFLVVTINPLLGQKKDKVAIDPSDSSALFTSKIGLMAKSYGDSVVLRWAPDKPGAWSIGNKIGYRIERVTFKADSTFDPAEFKLLEEQPIKAWPLDDWQKIIDPNDPNPYAAIAAQSLYGKSFNTEGIFEQADDYKNRYSFSLLAADISPVTATALGLRYVDTSVAKNKYYIYRVFLAEPSKFYKTDTAYVVVNGPEGPLPEIKVSEVQENELKVNLLWDRELYGSIFSAYYIEKSEDGKNFTRLNKHPYINPLSNDFTSNKKAIFYSDSLTENYKKYFYRIIGITPFGELSKGSNVIEAMGRDKTPPSPPSNIKTTHLGGTRVNITWKKPTKEPDLKGYVIGRSLNAGNDFQPLFTEPLPPNTTSFIDENANENGTNYYLVAALDTAGNGTSSLVSYAMIVDSLPPAAPQNLTGKIDSTGNVSLSWNLGTEYDLAGYMIYFSNAKDHVFTTLNNEPLQDSVYQDSIQILTLTEEIFYVIKAIDVSYNHSESSDTLRLIKPDLIPPSAPLFDNYKLSEEGVLLSWVPSSSKDVISYRLSRKDTAEFQLLKEVSGDPIEYSFLDSTAVPGVVYTYSIVAIDDANLTSNSPDNLSVKLPDLSKVPPVSKMRVVTNSKTNTLKISWQYNHRGDYRFVLYKAINGGPFQSYKSIKGNINEFNDYDVKKEKQYEYVLKVHLKNGKTSGFGKIVKGNL